MDAFEQFQQDVVAMLNSEEWMSSVPVVAHRPLKTLVDESDAGSALNQTKPEVEKEEFWLIKKDGVRSGTGVRVPMPSLKLVSKNLSKPQLFIACPILVAEQPGVSEAADGLNTSAGGWRGAEAVAMKVMDLLHHRHYDGTNFLTVDDNAIVQSSAVAYLRAYTVNIWATFRRSSDPRSGNPAIVVANGVATITAGGEGSELYYTLDGSTPVRTAHNPASVLYSAPFAVISGTVIRAMAFVPNCIGSSVVQITA
jgi:hypothetical protein